MLYQVQSENVTTNSFGSQHGHSSINDNNNNYNITSTTNTFGAANNDNNNHYNTANMNQQQRYQSKPVC